MVRLLLALCCWISATACQAAPDEDQLGKAQGYPAGTLTNWLDEPFRVGSFSAMDRVYPKHCLVATGASPMPLRQAAAEPKFRYGTADRTIDDFLAGHRTTGLLIVKDGEILVERYQYDRTREQRFLSQSIAKTVLSMAVGIALGEGKIASLDDPAAKYEKALAGTAYGETSLRNLLRMSSGVKYVEDYSGGGDTIRWFDFARRGGSLLASQQFNDRRTPQGQQFHYASSETEVLNLALRAATGRSLCDWTSEKIWQPMGAESSAVWLGATFDGVEYASFGFNATLRDYARLGLLLANDGRRGDKQIIPTEFVLDATRAERQPPDFRPGSWAMPSSWGYGYQTWIFPGRHPRFALRGIYGQVVFVDPALKLVLVHTSVGTFPLDYSDLDLLWEGVVKYFGEW